MTEPAPQGPSLPGRGIRVGRLFGVPVVISPAWLVIVVVATLLLPPTLRDHVTNLGTAGSYALAFGFVILVYAAVLVHEASHILVAKALGMQVGRIVVHLLGAVSEILDEPTSAAKEFLVAAVGPLSSVLLAGIGLAVGAAFPHGSVGWLLGTGFGDVNGLVAAFNLLPGLPLDGGHLLRSAVWQLTGNKMRGLLVAGQAGRGLAAGVALLGFLSPNVAAGNHEVGALYLFLLAFFMWTNASMTVTQARLGAALPSLDLRRLTRPALTVESQLPLAEAVRRARDAGARALVVVDSRDRWSGIVSEAAVQATPVDRQPWMSVSDLARPLADGLVLPPSLSGEELMRAVQKMPASEYLIAEKGGPLRGVLARTDLMAALRAARVR